MPGASRVTRSLCPRRRHENLSLAMTVYPPVEWKHPNRGGKPSVFLVGITSVMTRSRPANTGALFDSKKSPGFRKGRGLSLTGETLDFSCLTMTPTGNAAFGSALLGPRFRFTVPNFPITRPARRPPERERPELLAVVHDNECQSAYVGDALLGFLLVSRLRLRGKRENSCFLSFAEPRQQHDLAIGELERVMIDVKH